MILPISGNAADATTFIEKGAEWKYYYTTDSDVATSAPSEDWYSTDSWATEIGNAPFTGSSYAASDANVKFPNSVFSAFLAKTFTVEDMSSVGCMIMEIRYDQDPVVYLNGTQVWSTTGYKDRTYVQVNLSEYIKLLKDGDNLLTVYFHNPSGGGGAVFDMTLYGDDATDADGWFYFSGASCNGFYSFGDLNKPENILDNNQSTVCGSGYNAGVEQSVTAMLAVPGYVDSIFLQCKDEGTTAHEDGITRGTYSVYAVDGTTEALIAENVPARTGTDGGYTVTLDEVVKASAIKVVITSWVGTTWACVADIRVHQGETPDGADENLYLDSNGNFLAESVTNFGFSNFGSINAPTNILDGDETTCTGSDFKSDVEQGVLFNLYEVDYADSIFIQCKEEGTTTHEDGTTRGYYSIYAVNGVTETLVAENVPAVTGTNGGYTVKFAPIQAESFKVVITSWYGNCWANVADLSVHAFRPDLDQNGVINVADVSVLLDYLASSTTLDDKKYDIDSDGVSTITDITLLLDYLATK